MSRLYPESKVEVRGWEARHYDTLMNVLTLGAYIPFIHKAVRSVGLQAGERVMIFGAGTGRNADLMLEELGTEGQVTAWEIGEVMRSKFRARLGDRPNVALFDRRIDEPLPEPSGDGAVIHEAAPAAPYDHVFISFVLHGLPHESRLRVLDNAQKLLRPGGQFHILDYTLGPADAAPWYRRLLLNRLECPLAADFVGRDWERLLTDAGFEGLRSLRFLRGVVSLFSARRR